MTVEIRNLWGNDDWAEFLTVLSTLSPVLIDETTARIIYRERLQKGTTLIAIVDGKIVGTGSIWWERKFSHGEDGSLVGHIEDVAVLPGHQRQGVGKAVVGRLIEIVNSAKCRKIVLCCKEDIVPFYERLGMTRKGVEMSREL